MMFRNSAHGGLNMVYRRTDGNIGWVDPQKSQRLTSPSDASTGIMEIADLIGPNSVIADLRATSKKQALQELAERAAAVTGLHERPIFDVLLERERLGTTGVGNGIAIPHGKLAGLKKLHGVFARLSTPIDFEAIDERPVDLIFLLLAPERRGRRSSQGAGAGLAPAARPAPSARNCARPTAPMRSISC